MYNAANPWRKIESAPKNEWLEVCGASGTGSFPWFIAIAKFDPDYHPRDPWMDIHWYPLSDPGWKPLYWRKVSSFPRKEP
jgi:hypothetical protein